VPVEGLPETNIRGWKRVQTAPPLDRANVHVWAAALGEIDPGMAGVLAADERERAARFRFAADRERYTRSHAWMRVLLGAYLRRDPRAIVLSISPFGKPLAVSRGEDERLEFNLSHSGDVALLAVGADRPVGVDVEEIRADRVSEDVARRFFSRVEVDDLLRLSAADQAEAFFRCWTRKEAYVKARGEGLSRRLDRFAVSLGRGEAPELRPCGEGEEDAILWSLKSLAPRPGYEGAVAAEGKDWTLRRLTAAPALLTTF
jgi:4'-phosphopantetheinyl transferase